VACLRVAAASAITRLPVETSPVSETLATFGCRTRAWPVRASPWTTLNAPAGRPASANTSASLSAVTGVSSEGLNTIVFPQESAGADFQQAIWSG
jgi:hypothetical protein